MQNIIKFAVEYYIRSVDIKKGSMMKKLFLTTTILASFVLFTACGDDSSSGPEGESSSSVELEDESSSSEEAVESSSSEKAEEGTPESSEDIAESSSDIMASSSSAEISSDSKDARSSDSKDDESSSSEKENSSSSVKSDDDNSSSSEIVENSSNSGESSSSSSAPSFPEGVMPSGYYKKNCPEGHTCTQVDTVFLNQEFFTKGKYGEILDERDYQIYKVVTIGSQTWMAQNLNYVVDGQSWCYGDISDYCIGYGRLYTWAAAVGKQESECGLGYLCGLSDGDIKGVCPDGWHLPRLEEWKNLLAPMATEINATSEMVTFYSNAASSLKSSMGWGGSYNNMYGFSAVPNGYGVSSSKGVKFDYANDLADFWSASEYNENIAYKMMLGTSTSNATVMIDTKEYFYSVRCVKDSD